MKTFHRPNSVRGGGVPGDRPASGYVRTAHKRSNGSFLVLKNPKVRGKAAVKAAKRARHSRASWS